jgi:hypothetical protein
MFKHDYLEEQIETLSKTIAAMLFGPAILKNTAEKHKEKTTKQTNYIAGRVFELALEKLLESDEIEKLRKMLLQASKEKPSLDLLVQTLNFYNEILERNKMSKHEVEDDLSQIRTLYEKSLEQQTTREE